MTPELEKLVFEFLDDLAHGPCGSVDLNEYEKDVRKQAEEIRNALNEVTA